MNSESAGGRGRRARWPVASPSRDVRRVPGGPGCPARRVPGLCRRSHAVTGRGPPAHGLRPRPDPSHWHPGAARLIRVNLESARTRDLARCHGPAWQSRCPTRNQPGSRPGSESARLRLLTASGDSEPEPESRSHGPGRRGPAPGWPGTRTESPGLMLVLASARPGGGWPPPAVSASVSHGRTVTAVAGGPGPASVTQIHALVVRTIRAAPRLSHWQTGLD